MTPRSTETTNPQGHPDISFTLDTAPDADLVYFSLFGSKRWPKLGERVDLMCEPSQDPRVHFVCGNT